MLALHFLSPAPQQHHPVLSCLWAREEPRWVWPYVWAALSLGEAEGGVGTCVEPGEPEGGTADAISAGAGREEATL